jgi:enolase-phosphatase E1
MPKILLLDIEGTVGPISFVQEVLFPYSSERLLIYLRENKLEPELKESILQENQKDFENQEFAKIVHPDDPQEINAYLQFLIRTDRKFGGLKTIQGRIWKEGFELNDLKAELFSDVPRFLEEAVSKNYKIYIYSSGSKEAQNLFFKYSIFGDLGQFISGYFDTSIGGKKVSSSYEKIAQEIGCPPEDISFFTDIVEEADASNQAGYGHSILMDRPGNAKQPSSGYTVLRDLFGFFELG